MEFEATWTLSTWELAFFDTSLGSWISVNVWEISSFVVGFLWLMVLVWVIKDARARTERLSFCFLAGLVVILLTPVFWLPLYFAMRPAAWKWDMTFWREVIQLKGCWCENCGAIQSVDHRYCTACGESLQHPCRECSDFYSHAYEYCPSCWAPNIDQ